MPWKIRLFGLMDENKDDQGGGGGGGKDDKGSTGLAALEAKIAELEKKLGEKDKSAPKDEPDLAEKARKEREKNEQSATDTKKLAAAIEFDLKHKDWLKANEALLPKSIPSIFEMANKEVYSNAIEKDCAIKVGLISEFFAQQANVDLLTAAQKLALEDFQKLTKTVKQERAQNLYDSLFEPTFEMLKKLEKAKQLNAGSKNQTDSETAYKQKLIDGSRKHYLGEKK